MIIIRSSNLDKPLSFFKQKSSSSYDYNKCRLCGETVNHISECSKLAQKDYKSRYDWVGKVISQELCKRIKFDHAERWYMLKSEFVQ